MVKVPTEYQHLFDKNGQILQGKVDDLVIEVESGKFLFDCSIRDEVICLSCRRKQPFTERCARCGAYQIKQVTQTYAICMPNADQQMRGRIVYTRRLKALQERGIQTREALEQIGFEQGLLDRTKRDEKDAAVAHLERLRAAREMTNDAGQKVEFDLQMEQLRFKIVELSVDEATLFRHSAEHLAEQSRADYFIATCTTTGTMLEDLVWGSYESFLQETDRRVVEYARNALYRVQNGLPTVVVRAMARAYEWRQRWKTAKASGTAPFTAPIADWNPNQLSLSYWSDFYDSIYAHPERPEEATIQDDEALQTWINDQLQKQKMDRQQRGMHPGTGFPKGKVTMRDGSGREKVMVSLGSSRKDVKSPFKIRTGG